MILNDDDDDDDNNNNNAMWKQNAVQVIPIVRSSVCVIPKSLSQF